MAVFLRYVTETEPPPDIVEGGGALSVGEVRLSVRLSVTSRRPCGTTLLQQVGFQSTKEWRLSEGVVEESYR